MRLQPNNPACYSRNNIGQPWRNTWLDIGDDSGGIRQLPATVFNGTSYSGISGEDWGPGTNWACLSWRDANGNMHMWAEIQQQRPSMESKCYKICVPSIR